MEGRPFAKMVASGNDFVVMDNRDDALSHYGISISEIAKGLCERKRSVGADGMLLMEESAKAHFKMRIFNSDGSEVDMCGNGSRCVALYAVENDIASRYMQIETGAGIIDAEVVGLRVKIRLTDPKEIKLNLNLSIGKKRYKIHTINTGVPHVVSFVKDLDKVKVESIGSRIRHHKTFKPGGTNVNFVKEISANEIEVRTYERGVESETYACGTGSTASALITSLLHGMKSHIDVRTKSKETLRVYFDKKGKSIKNVYLEGEAKVVYNGRIDHV
ncbi:MAG: diaminopimelate epimerase [Candidatus Omnitrophica bacterium]|nr:diaminopimelate epimerase [Candidatus Omnitrophota bacterium]